MSSVQDPIRAIRVKYAQEAVPYRERLLREAWNMLREDFGNLDTLGAAVTHRANAVGLALLDAKLYSAADDLYEWLLRQVDAYIKTCADAAVADRAVLYRNWGVALTLKRDYDRGIPRLLKAKELAEQSGGDYDVEMADFLLDQRLERPAIYLLASLADHVHRQAYRREIEEQVVRDAFAMLGDGKYAIYGAVIEMTELWRSHRERPTAYTSLALLGELRTLVTGLESLARQLSGTAKDLSDAFRKLFGQKPQPSWWRAVTQQWNKTSYRDPRDFEDKLRELTNVGRDGDERFFARSFTVACLVRKFVAHQLIPSQNLISDELFPPAKCHVVAAFVGLHLAGKERTAGQGVTK